MSDLCFVLETRLTCFCVAAPNGMMYTNFAVNEARAGRWCRSRFDVLKDHTYCSFRLSDSFTDQHKQVS